METETAIRPIALSTASAWWTEGWFKIVVALGGLIIVAILVATFIVLGRNNSSKDQVLQKCRKEQRSIMLSKMTFQISLTGKHISSG